MFSSQNAKYMKGILAGLNHSTSYTYVKAVGSLCFCALQLRNGGGSNWYILAH
jgi:hypothetical protein